MYRVWGGNDRGLRMLNLDDRSVKTITTEWDNFPFWSPSGDRIVFTRQKTSDQDFDIFTMRPDGTHKRNLTHSPQVFDNSPDFSPGGGSIAYASRRQGHTKIWRMRSDGRRRHRVPISGSYSEQFDPTFSPNGRRFVFASATEFGTDNGLFVAPSGGGAAKAMLTGADLAGEATWQPR